MGHGVSTAQGEGWSEELEVEEGKKGELCGREGGEERKSWKAKETVREGERERREREKK
jgi:hypothetical protein